MMEEQFLLNSKKWVQNLSILKAFISYYEQSVWDLVLFIAN